MKLRWGNSEDFAGNPAAFGRLCVETKKYEKDGYFYLPAAFGRLCVETCSRLHQTFKAAASRLQAAVC